MAVPRASFAGRRVVARVRSRGVSVQVGVTLVAALAAWPLLAHGTDDASVRFVATVLGAGASYIVGVLLTRLRHLAVPVLVAGGVAMTFAATVPASLQGGAVAPPLGYANANGALLVAAVAGLVGATVGPQRAGWRLVALAAVPFAVAAALTGSLASAATCIALLAVMPFLRRGTVGAWQLTAALTLLAGFATTVLLGATYHPAATGTGMSSALSATRLALWSDALDMAVEHPVAGVGPGRFADLSATAADPDLAWAHSEPLQVLAETGFVGLALLAGLVAWLCLRLGRGAAILALVALQPMVDYVLHFPAVTLTLTLVLGALDQSRRMPLTRRGGG